MISSSSNPEGKVMVKLIDFGCAYKLKPGELLEGLCGSKFYLAPEVLKGKYN